MAPEIVTRSYNYDGVKADVFSLGVLFFIIAFGVPPFHNAHIEDKLYSIAALRP